MWGPNVTGCRKNPNPPRWESNLGRRIERLTLYHVAVKAGFYSDVVEWLPVDPATWVRFPALVGKIFLLHNTYFFGEKTLRFCHIYMTLLWLPFHHELPNIQYISTFLIVVNVVITHSKTQRHLIKSLYMIYLNLPQDLLTRPPLVSWMGTGTQDPPLVFLD